MQMQHGKSTKLADLFKLEINLKKSFSLALYASLTKAKSFLLT